MNLQENNLEERSINFLPGGGTVTEGEDTGGTGEGEGGEGVEKD
ncbi:hypothetical protein [Polaribacter marinus]|nr:hypothetical protein [Polaribacter marinus]